MTKAGQHNVCFPPPPSSLLASSRPAFIRFVGYHRNNGRPARVNRSPVDVVDLWCLQAEATLSFMAEKEQALRDLSLTLPFFLLEVCPVVYFVCAFCAIAGAQIVCCRFHSFWQYCRVLGLGGLKR